MNALVVSWNDHLINTNEYHAFIPIDSPLGNTVQTRAVQRENQFPVMAGKVFAAGTLALDIEITGRPFSSLREQLFGWLNPYDTTPRKLVVMDQSSGEQFYIYATPNIPSYERGLFTFVLDVMDSVWKAVVPATEEWHDLTTSPQTKALTIEGNTFARPKITLTPRAVKGGQYRYRYFVPIYNPGEQLFLNYPFDLTNGGWDTSTLVTAGKMLASGDDLLVYIDGRPVSRWLVRMNQSNTLVWAAIRLSPGCNSTLGVALTIDATEITLSAADSATLGRMPTSGIVKIQSEILTYTGKNLYTRKLTGVSRGQRGSTAATHVLSTAVNWIEHDIWFVHGYTLAEPPVLDSATEPIIDMTASTNTSWVYSIFADELTTRGGVWRDAVLASTRKTSESYTATQHTENDPATEMGMAIVAKLKGSSWQNETAEIMWRLDHPAGITHIAASGYRYRHLTWPTVESGFGFTVLKSKKLKWTKAAGMTIASPASAETWDPWTLTSTALAATKYTIRVALKGTVGAHDSNKACLEVGSCTLTLAAGGIPVASIMSVLVEQTDGYFLDAILGVDTGEEIILKYSMKVNDVLVIDTDARTVTYNSATNASAAITFSSVRSEWLPLEPGSRTLTYTEDTISDIDIDVEWQIRKLTI